MRKEILLSTACAFFLMLAGLSLNTMGCGSDDDGGTTDSATDEGDDGDDGADNKGAGMGSTGSENCAVAICGDGTCALECECETCIVDCGEGDNSACVLLGTGTSGGTSGGTGGDTGGDTGGGQTVSDPCVPDDISSTTGIKCGIVIGALTAFAAHGAGAAVNGAPALISWLKTIYPTAVVYTIQLTAAGTPILVALSGGGPPGAPEKLFLGILQIANMLGVHNYIGKSIGWLIDQITAPLVNLFNECSDYFDAANACIEEIAELSVLSGPGIPASGSGFGTQWAAICITSANNASGLTDLQKQDKCEGCCIDQLNYVTSQNCTAPEVCMPTNDTVLGGRCQKADPADTSGSKSPCATPEVINSLPGARAFCHERCVWFQ